MKSLLTIFLLLVVFTFDSAAYEINELETRKSIAQELYVKSGLAVQLQDSPQVIISSLEKQKQMIISDNLGDEKKAALNQYFDNLNKIAEVVYDAGNLKKTFIDYFENELTIIESKQILNWLDSSVGLKCTKAEEIYTETEKMNEYNSFVIKLKKDPPSEERTQIAERFIKANDMIDRSVDLLTNMQLAQTIALVYALSPESSESLMLAKKRIEKAKPRIRRNLELIMVSRILFIYQDISNSEFEQYLNFLETPIGRKYTKVSSDAYDVAFTRASYEFGEKVGELLQSKKDKTEI